MTHVASLRLMTKSGDDKWNEFLGRVEGLVERSQSPIISSHSHILSIYKDSPVRVEICIPTAPLPARVLSKWFRCCC